jgi:integrase
LWRDYVGDWYGPTVLSGARSVGSFCSLPGEPRLLSPETLAGRFTDLARRTGAEGPVSLHRVRHTVATTLVGSGQIEGAQHRLRHSRLDTTLRHYVDTTGLGEDVDVADELERWYGAGEPLVTVRPVL